MLVAIPGLGTYIDVAVSINIGDFGFVTSFAGENQMLFEVFAFSIEIFPDKPLMGWLTGQRTSARKDVKVTIVIKVGHSK